MILQNIDYFEFPDTIGHWSLKDLNLVKINLLVGKNASGKTRTLDVIDNIRTIILKGIPAIYPHTGRYYAELFDDSDIYQYTFELSSNIIINEELVINNNTMLERKGTGIGKIFASKENKMIDFQIPDTRPALFLRQDTIQYPYLQKIFDWAENLQVYNFGGYLGKDKGLSIYVKDTSVIPVPNSEDVVWFFKQALKEFGDTFEKLILEKMRVLGYNLTKLWVNPYVSPYNGRALQVLCTMEDYREDLLFQTQMSQGMFRALSLLIQINYNIMSNMTSTILIDDIGEGLDFERSTKLIKLLIELAEKNDNIQLIMSTNDRFVMNSVPLEYWQVIQRSGGECRIYNYHNSKEIFDEFAYTGLNNFDFLATDFINSEKC
jgi:energy-coupling factor transporter ATP-binding protein EcfA2